MAGFIDLTGKRFGRLEVLGRAANKGVKVTWACRCDCGKSSVAFAGDLRSGRHTSCGCYHREKVSRHGHSKASENGRSLTYSSWTSMRSRCTNENDPAWWRYGGAGITVCDQWSDFQNFLRDMGERPSLGHSIDRIDGTRGYSPENCRWATRKEQSRNMRSNRHITKDGETKTVAEWAEVSGINEERLRGRVRSGKSDALILSSEQLPNNRIDLTGRKFGRLEVVSYADTVNKRARWNCRCDCGRECVTVGKDLRQGRTVSCGCKRGF